MKSKLGNWESKTLNGRKKMPSPKNPELELLRDKVDRYYKDAYGKQKKGQMVNYVVPEQIKKAERHDFV